MPDEPLDEPTDETIDPSPADPPRIDPPRIDPEVPMASPAPATLEDHTSVDTLVTIVSFEDSFEAHLAKGKLEAEGFSVYLDNENISSVGGWFYANITGGIKLKVPRHQAEAAAASLPQRAFVAVYPCPRCGSERTAQEPPPRGLVARPVHALVSLFITTPWSCAECGHRWIPGNDEEANDHRDDDRPHAE